MSNKPDRIELHRNDLPHDAVFLGAVAIDTETTGLSLKRDRLCLVQLAGPDGVCHLVQFPAEDGPDFAAPNLRNLLANPHITKLFHFARFDIAVLQRQFGPIAPPFYCTKIASKLVRTYTDRHGLKDLCRELLGVELSKEQQSSDWGTSALTPEQRSYAAQDVFFLHRLRERLDAMLQREGRFDLSRECFAFLPIRAALDLGGWADEDIFAH
ncbi:MAG: ribonuclease D [Alphaproteobacteria bacterium]|nr:ribonuclease D [Alphaproteobacteria bacterium]